MSREWKPGDVAMVDAEWTRSRPFEDCLAILRARGWERVSDGAMALNPNPQPRGVAVIDPEDAEQVERLRKALDDLSFSAWACGAATCLSQVLRKFANPTLPKPEEPTDVGAVVEDKDGKRWVRWYCDSAPWLGYHVTVEPRRCWDAINAVRVLSDGVPSEDAS